MLYKDAILLDIDDKNIIFTPAEGGTVSVSMKGTSYGFLFEENKLARKIVEDVVDGYDGSDFMMPNLKDLEFSLIDKESLSFDGIENINFTLSGNIKIIYKIDEEKFISELLNKQRKQFTQILTLFKNIESTELIFRPFWKKYFPEKSENIEIIVNYPEL